MFTNDPVKLSEEEFVTRSIFKLRVGKYKGIHAVYSGFNDAFSKYFGTDPIETTTRLAKEGIIIIRPAKGGVTLYLPGDAPICANNTLNKILED